MIRQIEGVQVNIYQNGEGGACFYVGESDREEGSADRLAERLAEKAGNVAYTLIIFEITDWDAQLSPWPARSTFGEEPFRGKGADTLSWLTDRCIPALKAEGLIANDVPQYIAGYSLSGLFALWSLLESDMFDGAASCSGSLWFDGWMDYVRSKKISRNVSVYLSLGSKEERTKNPLMQTVGDCTRETYEYLKKHPAVKRTALQWNKGGHFADADERLIKGILWLMNLKEGNLNDRRTIKGNGLL